jgi:PAS domain S-box-containing protein
LWSNTVFTPRDSDDIIALAIGHDITMRKSTESALRESEARYRAVWDNFPVGICLTDKDGIYQYVNPAYCRMYGFSKEELIGRPPDGLIFPPADREERKKRYNRRFDIEIPNPLREYVFHCKNGESIWVEVSSDFIRQNGKPRYLISMNVDISKRKLAEAALIESEQRYRLLFENAGEAIFTVRSDGVFSMMNKEAAAYLGGKPGEFIGKNMRELFPHKIAERQMKNIARALDRNKHFILEEMTVLNNDLRWFRTGIYPIKDNENSPRSALLIARDITDEVRNKIRVNTRLRLLENLRHAESVDDCLRFACAAIFEAELFRRAVMTLHNSDREIEYLGQVGLEDSLVEQARKAKAPSRGLARKMTRNKFKLGQSYFVPAEAMLNYRTTKRYIPAGIQGRNLADSWKIGDELFVPVLGSNGEIEGWLSVDTPFDGKRPSSETIRFLEEITDIVTQRSREILNRIRLDTERKALQDKNIALKEILGHIEDEKAEFKQRIGENIENILLPALNRILNESGSINESNLNILKNSLSDISTLAGGITQLYSKLSPRELEICSLIRIGTSSKEIAATLRISAATVLKHRETIRRKLGLINKDVNLMSFLNNL